MRCGVIIINRFNPSVIRSWLQRCCRTTCWAESPGDERMRRPCGTGCRDATAEQLFIKSSRRSAGISPRLPINRGDVADRPAGRPPLIDRRPTERGGRVSRDRPEISRDFAAADDTARAKSISWRPRRRESTCLLVAACHADPEMRPQRDLVDVCFKLTANRPWISSRYESVGSY